MPGASNTDISEWLKAGNGITRLPTAHAVAHDQATPVSTADRAKLQEAIDNNRRAQTMRFAKSTAQRRRLMGLHR